MGTSERPRPTVAESTNSLHTPEFLPHQLETTIVTAAVGRNLGDRLDVTNRDLLRTVNVLSETAEPVITRAREILGPGSINIRTLTQHDQTELENLLRPPLAPEPSTGTWPLFREPFTDFDLLRQRYSLELNAKGHASHVLQMRVQTTADSQRLEEKLQEPLAEHNLKLGQLPLNSRRPTLVSVDLMAEQMLQVAGA
ncbi:hypothetical protein HYS00_04045, partial [Candidatus Microgenomates bacterium]|nr:hypothetical protein [Candidatus Microgenomates bacterium]